MPDRPHLDTFRAGRTLWLSLFQPATVAEVQERRDGAADHQTPGPRITEGPFQLGHELEVHAVHAGDQGWRQKGHAGHREYLDDLVLVNVDETHGGVHQEVDL